MSQSVLESLATSLSWQHERVHIVQDADSGLRAIIAVHSTALGPALGGMRLRQYEHGLPEALDDALRLSRGMTLKASAAGLDLGGGKSVVMDDGDAGAREARLVALAREIERLGGSYITAEDIGTTIADMEIVARHTGYVVGRAAHDGIGGDPSPATARTVYGATEMALQVLDGEPSLHGRTVGIIGLGKVGAELARMQLAAGARVCAYDPRVSTVRELERAGVEAVDSVAELLARPLDVLAPCAVGGMIDETVAGLLNCRIVCGAANNPLADDATAVALAARDILYVPDFLANSGGLIHVDFERRNEPDPAVLEAALATARARTLEALEQARAEDRLPSVVAEESAWARVHGRVAEPVPAVNGRVAVHAAA